MCLSLTALAHWLFECNPLQTLKMRTTWKLGTSENEGQEQKSSNACMRLSHWFRCRGFRDQVKGGFW